MNRASVLCTLAAATLLALAVTGCGAPAALERSQQLQLAAMVQYRDEMAAYHEKVTAQLAEEKRAQLDAALAASLTQSADVEGRIDVATAVETLAKRIALEDEYRAALARLDSEFAQRQAAIGRAIELAEDTLDLVTEYGRLASLLRNLFVREAEARRTIDVYQTERSSSDAGSPSQPETGGR
jgi:hypothetical protein